MKKLKARKIQAWKKKKASELHGFTDYPCFDQDEPGSYKQAPIRKCEIVHYDGDKYCDLKVHNEVTGTVDYVPGIKAGYIYKNEVRCGDPKTIYFSLDELHSVYNKKAYLK